MSLIISAIIKCLENVLFPVQTKIKETDFLVPFPVLFVHVAKKMSGNPP